MHCQFTVAKQNKTLLFFQDFIGKTFLGTLPTVTEIVEELAKLETKTFFKFCQYFFGGTNFMERNTNCDIAESFNENYSKVKMMVGYGTK